MRRLAVLAGVCALGSVSFLKAPEKPPSCAPMDATPAIADHRDEADQRPPRELPRPLPRLAELAEEADGQPRAHQQHELQQEQDAEGVAVVGAGGRGQVLRRQAAGVEGPGDDADRGDHGGGEGRGAAQAQRHDCEPGGEAHDERKDRPARVGEHQADEQRAERGEGERVEGGVPRAAAGQPQHRRDAHRRRQADGVPVAERRAQAGGALVGRERLREDLRQQRVDADDRAAEPDAGEHCAPAGRREPGEGEGAAERGQVGERAIGLEPGRVGIERPGDGQCGQRGEDAEQAECPAPVERAEQRAPVRDGQGAGAEQAAAGDEHDLHPRVRLELQTALGDEGEQADDRARPRW